MKTKKSYENPEMAVVAVSTSSMIATSAKQGVIDLEDSEGNEESSTAHLSL